MPVNAQPAVAKSLKYIEESLASGRFGSAIVLPSVKTLADSAGVSIASMHKAVKILLQSGLITEDNKHNYVVEAQKMSPAFEPSFADRFTGDDGQSLQAGHRRLAERLRTDILNGAFDQQQTLPSYKELRSRYRTNFRTLKKALWLLHEEGLLVAHKRTYAVSGYNPEIAERKIRLFAMVDTSRHVSLEQISQNFLRILEMECNLAKVKFELIGFVPVIGPPFEDAATDCMFVVPGNADLTSMSDDDDTLGYVFLRVAVVANDELIFQYLSRVNKPVAVLDLTQDMRLPAHMQKRNVRLFSAAVSPRCATRTAHYLLSLGHRKIAYISPFHRSVWSRNRHAGLNDVFKAAGNGCCVNALTWDNPPNVYGFYFEEATRLAGFEALQLFYESWKKRIPEQFAENMDPYFDFELPYKVTTDSLLQVKMEMLFRQALAIKECSVWVCANDKIALFAIAFLKKRKLFPPRPISVISFDDTYEALQAGLTSYNFNLRSMVHRILGFLNNTRTAPQSRKPVEVDGMIMERYSTKAR
ncbi:MAG: GntR family transcriptional regulator [Chitinivibrionales bacterium]|nr:GntR family transcriptional regulator [Chitinivibrionales bacterium]